MPRPALIVEISGEVDFDSLDPILVEQTGRRWRLKNAPGLLVGDQVTVAATQEGRATLLVRAAHVHPPDYHRCH